MYADDPALQRATCGTKHWSCIAQRKTGQAKHWSASSPPQATQPLLLGPLTRGGWEAAN